jgi:hypothetical protein
LFVSVRYLVRGRQDGEIIINAGKYWALAVVEDQKGEGGRSEGR